MDECILSLDKRIKHKITGHSKMVNDNGWFFFTLEISQKRKSLSLLTYEKERKSKK